MNQPKLYLFIGYPGAGKTTVAQIIADETGAKHLWADVERHKIFKEPTHSIEESNQLYDELNKATDYLLSQGRDVVFDTNFNYYSDREKLRVIAKKNNAKTILLWITTPIEVAKQRATNSQSSRNLYAINMSVEQFDAIASKLEPPYADEKYIKINCQNVKKEKIINLVLGKANI
jgi:predicted kinase